MPLTRFRRFCRSSSPLFEQKLFCRLLNCELKSPKPLSRFNLSCRSWRSLSDSVPLSKSGNCGELVWLFESTFRSCVAGDESNLKNDDGWNVFEEKKLLLSSNKPNFEKRDDVSITLFVMLLVSGWQFVLISAVLPVLKLSLNSDCEVFSKLVLFCCLSTSSCVVWPFSGKWSGKLAGELLPLTLSLTVPLSPLLDRLCANTQKWLVCVFRSNEKKRELKFLFTWVMVYQLCRPDHSTKHRFRFRTID